MKRYRQRKVASTVLESYLQSDIYGRAYDGCMFQVAVYGKGGIGKSTMSANISVALAGRGLKVMQIGCDPKHDSTRLLLGGRSQRTVLDYVRETPIGRRRLEDVIETGTSGVLCAEAGGPEPGIGCAGRGILTTFDTLRKLGADELPSDVRIYDVLGDVVCGGFAVPLRDEYADAVVIVTSGEFMAMYAANNIMRGLGNFDNGRPRLLGLILNSRGVEGERESVERFARAAGTRVIAAVPRDGLFAEAESRGHTVMELFPDSEAAAEVRRVADEIARAASGEDLMTDPRPLDDLQMSDLAAGREIRPPSGEAPIRTGCGGCRRTSISDARVMVSCASYGAASAFARLGDTAVIVHGPMSCAYLMSTTRSKALLGLYEAGVLEGPPSMPVRSSAMDDSAAVFGGDRYLEWAIERAVSEGYGRVAAVTTCMPGIIGDDCAAVVQEARLRHPDARIDLVQADGDIIGDFSDGFIAAVEVIADRIDPSVPMERGLVNIVGSSFFDLHSRTNRSSLERMLSAFGMRVNCMFLDDSSPSPPELFCRAETDILVGDNAPARKVMSIVTERTGREPFPAVLPLGIRDYERWVREMGAFTGREDLAEAECARARAEHEGLVGRHRPRMEGVRIILRWKAWSNPDWLIDVLEDLGVDLVRVGFMPSAGRARMRPISSHDCVEDYTDAMLAQDLEALRPDILISDIAVPVPDGTAFAKLSKLGVGYRPVFGYIEYLENVVRLPKVEGWREGRSL